MRQAIGNLHRLLLTATLCAALVCPAAADVERQRELFSAVFKAAERGDWRPVEALPAADRDVLEDYLLWPDLRAAYLRATLETADRDDVDAFLDRYGVLRPARDLRYRYAFELARRGDRDAFLELYSGFYQGRGIARLDCRAIAAMLESGATARTIERARALWLVGHSQVGECDPVFAFLNDNSLLTLDDYRSRYRLAIDAREYRLARWLGKSIDDASSAAAGRWLSAQTNPEDFLRGHRRLPGDGTSRAQLVYAAERLTYRDPELALERWRAVLGRYPFTDAERHRVARHIALWTARDGLPGADALLHALPAAAVDAEVLRWRARTSLRREAWLELLGDIAAMPEDERQSEEWRYWHAVARQATGQLNAAAAGFERLAAERSYHGFLAADAIGRSYAFEHSELDADEALLAALATRADLARARELFLVGLDGRGRAEWDDVMTSLAPGQRAHAAILADRWGWHSRAIATVAAIGEYDDLSIRYPLPFREIFEAHAKAANIPPTWAYGIARSESLFMRDIRSGAGAIGLMQLMPATGREVAREINLPYSGLDTLVDPESNIRLGTAYLARMAERYGGHRVLATAAYNAGPERVDRWIPHQGAIDGRIWVENIPFNETRGYVRRVLAAETIFHWRITGSTRRLSDELTSVTALPAGPRLAQLAEAR